jgi:hypothetical protein
MDWFSLPCTVRLLIIMVVTTVALGTAPVASAHKHFVETGDGGEQYIANEQNHPGFSAPDENGLRTSCDGQLIPADGVGAAWYGLETAHHGPDRGAPGRGDDCYTTASDTTQPGNPLVDNNPAIDTHD